MIRVAYKEGYEYQLVEDYFCDVAIYPPKHIDTYFLRLSTGGKLIIKAGYAWDGASGPTIDTKNTIRGSLVHDALYQLMREGHLSHEWRKQADKELYRILREDGMSALRAKLWYAGVRLGGGPAVENNNPVLYAPE